VYLTSCSALSSDHLLVLIDTACHSSFQHPSDRPDFRRTDWVIFQTHLQGQITFDPELHNRMAIDTCVENFSGAVLKALAASTHKCRPRDDPLLPIPAGIQDMICLKNGLRRRWQVTSEPALKTEVNRLQRSVTRRLNERRNDQWSATLETLETLADSLQTQFRPVTDPSVPEIIEMVDVALRSYFLTPASEPNLTNPDEVQEAVRCLKVSKALGPNSFPNRTLKYLAQRAVSLLVQIFNAVFLTHHFSTVWKHARVISVLKPGNDPAPPSSYRPISFLDTIGKLFEKTLLARILHEVSERGLMRDERFGFRPRLSTSLQLSRLVERITRNFGEKRLTGAIFLDVAKAFDTVWIDGLLYKLPLLNFPPYIVHTISSYLRGRTFEASFQTAT